MIRITCTHLSGHAVAKQQLPTRHVVSSLPIIVGTDHNRLFLNLHSSPLVEFPIAEVVEVLDGRVRHIVVGLQAPSALSRTNALGMYFINLNTLSF